MNFIGLRALALTAALALPAVPAQAALVTFLGENLAPAGGVSGAPVAAKRQWLGEVENVGRLGFEGLTHKQHALDTPIRARFAGRADPLMVSITGGVEIDATAGEGRYATTGEKFLETFRPGDAGDGGDFTMTFSEEISAFGFFATDVGDFNNRIVITLINGTTRKTVEIENTRGTAATQDGSLLFFGFVDPHQTWRSVLFQNEPGSLDRFGFDNLVVGDALAAVPLPGALALGLAGIGALGAVRIGRRRA